MRAIKTGQSPTERSIVELEVGGAKSLYSRKINQLKSWGWTNFWVETTHETYPDIIDILFWTKTPEVIWLRRKGRHYCNWVVKKTFLGLGFDSWVKKCPICNEVFNNANKYGTHLHWYWLARAIYNHYWCRLGRAIYNHTH